MAINNSAVYENVHCEYAQAAPLWNMLDLLYAGQYAMKRHDWRLANTSYSAYNVDSLANQAYGWGEFVVRHNKQNTSEQAKAQYYERVNGAILFNAYARTVDALQGQVFSKEPIIDLSGTGVEFIVDDIDGNGLSLNQQAQQSLQNTLRKGRFGLLADYPQRVDEDGNVVPASQAQINSLMVRPTITTYQPQSILDWREEVIGGVKRLSMVKLLEFIETDEPTFENSYCVDQDYQYRWLVLLGGEYHQAIENSEGIRSAPIRITDANGAPLGHIPFSFIGSSNNSSDVDKSPTLDLADLNIGHYRNSADNEEAAWLVAQPTLFMYSSLDAEQFKEQNQHGICMGSRSGHNLGKDGRAELVQAEERNQLNTLKDEKVEGMRQLGAALLTPQANVTAEATRIDKASEVSILGMVAQNVELAYRDRIRDCMLFQTGNPDVDFQLSFNDDFYAKVWNAQEATAWVGLVQGGLVSRQMMWQRMRDLGEIPSDMTDEQIQEAIDNGQSNLPFVGE